MLCATYEGEKPRIVGCVFSEERTDALLELVACYAPRSSIHKGQTRSSPATAPQQRIRMLKVAIKGPEGNDDNF